MSLRTMPCPFVSSVVLAVALAGCSRGPAEVRSDHPDESRSVKELLDSASVITLHKPVSAFGSAAWSIEADGKKVASIGSADGRVAIISEAGNPVGSRTEGSSPVTHSLTLYDETGAQSGRVDEEVISLLYKFSLFDAHGAKIGTMEEKLGLGFSGDIQDGAGQSVWHVDEEAFSVGTAIKLERKAQSSVGALPAIWVTVLAKDAKDEDRDSSG